MAVRPELAEKLGFVVYNFVRLHCALNSLTPAQVAGLNLSARSKHKLLFVV
ncbi:hypothetical protein [Pectinatus haikarae]|uniref:hypothetical protein n=1 Tax=Pectinatus haikarae TaxID=349096 RepID=UPI0018C804DB|nr:hypothetical protein [Pectinatus haikarae]